MPTAESKEDETMASKSETIDISGLDKAAVLAALYNASKPQGLGFLHFTPGDMTIEQAREALAVHTTAFGGRAETYVDYLNGRVMKVEVSGDELDPWGYDRDNGVGAAARALEGLTDAHR